MKNLIILLSFLSVFSCKKAQQNNLNQTNSKEIGVDKNWCGDALISDLNFVNSINSTCKLNTPFFDRSEQQVEDDDSKCILSKIKFDYTKLDSLKTKILIGTLGSETKLFIKNSPTKKKEKADLYYETILYTENNNTLVDSLIIYQSINYSEALTVTSRYYYIENNKIFLLDFFEDESGASAENCSKYVIEPNGKIKLTGKEKIEKKNDLVSKDSVVNNPTSFIGKYSIDTKAKSYANNEKEINLGYIITVKSNDRAILSIDAENAEDYWCEGEYKLINEDNILHAKGKCDQDDQDDFYLKQNNGTYFIKSKRFLNKDWQQLTKG